MQLKTLVNAFALALFAAGAHATIDSGIYTITNGRTLGLFAITFNGQDKAATVTLANGAPPQQVYHLDLMLIITFL